VAPDRQRPDIALLCDLGPALYELVYNSKKQLWVLEIVDADKQ
jgi:hypothetical protein